MRYFKNPNGFKSISDKDVDYIGLTDTHVTYFFF